jgi:hypothetical protein
VKKTPPRNRGAAEAAFPWWDRSQRLLVGAAVALLISAPLIPSESAAPLGTHVVLVMAWLLLTAVWLVRCWLGPHGRWNVGRTEGAIVLFLLAHCASALMMLHAGHARPTLNAMWLWIAFGLLFLSVRQLFRSPLEQRALVSAMVALAVGLSVYGLYQVGYSDPLLRAEYARDPEEALRKAGVDAPPGSPQRQQFENRLASTEPTGPFALTNSLAGFLTPGLVLLLFVVSTFREKSPGGWPYAMNVLLPTLVVAGCLLLTKSRSAYGAVLVGVVLLASSRAMSRQWFRWPVILGAASVLILVTAVAVRLGGLDRQVITEAPKSLTYRLQYWRATSAMVTDHPWFGCGPGNFKSFYTRYKAPEASETVADPHNFLLEIAATAGVPALILFLLIGVALGTTLSRRRTDATCEDPPKTGPSLEHATVPIAASPTAIYVGVMAGFVLAYPAGWAGGLAPDLALLWVACPAAAGTLWLLHAWVLCGSLPQGPLIVAGIALLVNLLAAGGIGYPGVGQFVWLLAALVLNAGSDPGFNGETRLALSCRGQRGLVTVALAAVLLLVGACYVTMYRPVLAARQDLEESREVTTAAAAKRALTRAVAADPWWGEPWEFLAELESRQWIAASSDERLAAFFASRDGLLARDRDSSRVYRLCGDWLLEMFAASKRADLGAEAVHAYTKAVELYPHSGILHAQLAWACHVTGAEEQARKHADEALRLDALTPHSEFKLARQRVVADYLAESSPPARDERTVESAEQLMQRVRKVKNR